MPRALRDWTFDRWVKLGLTAAAAGAILALALIRGADLWLRHDLVVASGTHRAESFSLVLAAYLRQTFSAADASLRQLALHAGRVGGPSAPASAWMPALTSAQAAMTAVGSLSVVDRDGIIKHSTQPLIVSQSRRDLFLFQRLAASTGDHLFVDRPFRTISTPVMLVIPLGRRLTAPAGEFDGAIVATLVPEALRDVFRQVDVGRGGLAWVFHPDGVIVLREPSPISRIGEAAGGNPLFDAARRGGASGVHRGRLAPEGPTLVSAWRALEDPAIIVAVSLSEAELLADWRR